MPAARLPYPGLRSFTREETDLFFGREGCVDDMVDRLAATRFLAVLGASGSGKSSLVKTGLLDALELGLLRQAGSRWLIADFRPGDRPLESLAEALARLGADDPGRPPDADEVALLHAFVGRGPRAVVEWCAEPGNLPDGTNLLLLVDQFEELFRYSAYSEREEAEAFVATLLESARAPLTEARIYVVITMRSEYLGAAALIRGLAEAINKGLYLTPRMSREEVREAIVGPAAVCGFTIEPALVNRLLNDLATFAPWDEAGDGGRQLERLVRRADQLPLMQHVLNRLWSTAATERDGKPIVLTLASYEALGGLRGALAAHGREVLDALLPEHKAIAGTVFRALSAGASLADAVRRPTEFGELVAIADGDEIAVREVVEAFRAPGRSFLMPPREVSLRARTVVDISHESLIRQWDAFAGWLHEEARAADTWRRLVDADERYRRREGNLLSGLALAGIASWWDQERPNAAWAKRYGGDFDQAEAFLERSRKAEADAIAGQERERRQRIRNRFVTAAIAVILVIIAPLAVLAGYQALQARSEAERANAAATAAEAARQTAEAERATAEAERQRADAERQRAVVAQAEAVQQAEMAEAARQLALEEARQRELASQKERQAIRAIYLDRVASRALDLQEEGSWDSAGALLADLWREVLAGHAVRLGDNAASDPMIAAFRRQNLAEYAVTPDFLSYAGLSGWTGTTGRFRVYVFDTDRDIGAAAGGHGQRVAVFDSMTGAVTGSFALPAGSGMGTDLDLVAPDGRRAVVVTDRDDIVLWDHGQADPFVVPMPSVEGSDVRLAQLAPVSTDQRFVLHLTRSGAPGDIVLADPETGALGFSVSLSELAEAAELSRLGAVRLLGLVDSRIYVLLDDGDHRGNAQIVSVAVADGAVNAPVAAAGMRGAALSPDGGVLLVLSCPPDCDAQRLTAYATADGTALWHEPVPHGMRLSPAAIKRSETDGATTFSALVTYEGSGLIFRFAKDRPDIVERLDGRSHARIGAVTYDGDGNVLTVANPAGELARGATATGVLTDYRLPLTRQKLPLNAVANAAVFFSDAEKVQLAGVTYGGDLRVFGMNADGRFIADPNFPSISLGEADCVAALAFGGEGRSLLVRHADGALRYVAAAGRGAGVGWHRRASGEASAFAPATPPVQCPPSDTSAGFASEQIVPIDMTGRSFALRDRDGAVWRIDVGEDAAPQGRRNRADSEPVGQVAGPSAAGQWAFEPPVRVASGIQWVTADPQRRRIALVRSSAVDIVLFDDATAAEVRGMAAAGIRTQRLTRRGEPRAAAFDDEGTLAVAYAGGALVRFVEGADGWAMQEEVTVPVASVAGLFVSEAETVRIDKSDRVTAVDTTARAIAAHGRLWANPVAVSMLRNGDVLSLEWDTDAVARTPLAKLPPAAAFADTARLVAMRSRPEAVDDSSIEALLALGDSREAEAGCSEISSRNAWPLLADLIDAPRDDRPNRPALCVGADDGAFADTLRSLLTRGRTADIRQRVTEPAFARLLHAAGDGDESAERYLAAMLARIAIARGEVDPILVAEEALRLGATVPPIVLKSVAAGAAIPASLLVLARERIGDPAAHQLIAHWNARQIDDIDVQSEAFFQFALAEKLYGNHDVLAAQFNGRRRAQLARILPDERVLAVAGRLEAWEPASGSPLPGVAVADPPTDPEARLVQSLSDVERMARAWPDSRLLSALKRELERARIYELRQTDPERATDMMLELGADNRAVRAGSSALVQDYLALADGIADADAVSAFRLAVAALLEMEATRASGGPIHADADAVALYGRAADRLVTSIGAVPPPLVAAAAETMTLALAQYDYATLPEVGAEPEILATEDLLAATANIAEAIAAAGGETALWDRRRADALFWRAVLLNDRDKAAARELLSDAARLLRGVVEGQAANPDTRFRYAEALRWLGLAQARPAARLPLEREAVRQYRIIWRDRLAVDAPPPVQLSLGYGFALANLAKTIREIELADFGDGRGTDDHAGWVLELLALAAESHAVHQATLAVDASAGDPGYLDGWYRMSAYGWPIAFLSGALSAEATGATASECDRLASDPFDPGRLAPGRVLQTIDLAKAEAACAEALQRSPDDARAAYQLARIMSADIDRADEFLPLARAAAEKGVAPASTLVALALSAADNELAGQAHMAASQRTLMASFPILHRHLMRHATDDGQRAGLAWFANAAAALGVPEAHLVLAEMTTDPLQKLFHLRIAARLLREQERESDAAAASAAAKALPLTAAELAPVARRAAAWQPQVPITLPDGRGGS